MKKINLFIISLTFFSFLIFVLGNYFFWSPENILNERIENLYIEPSITKNENILDKDSLSEGEKEKIKVALKSAYNINFIYFPNSFKSTITDYTNAFRIFLNSKEISNKIDDLKIEFYEEKNDVRWKMKNHSVKLYWVDKMDVSECSAVWIHEFAHFIDLYFLKKQVFTDSSDYFYNISWESVKVLKPWLIQLDFVSWYSMTNKYEDFAESFTYFILHNEDFLEKTKQSKVLKDKYNFFTTYLFREWKFEWSNFSTEDIIMSYYRDITKIDFSLENFLEFLKK